MKYYIFILLYSFCYRATGQDLPVVKKILVEYTSEKPKKQKFNFSWSKEFDESGRVSKHSYCNNIFSLVEKYDYQYDSLDRILEYKSNSCYENGDFKKSTFEFEYLNDSIIENERSVMNDTIFDFEKTIYIYDTYDNLLLKRKHNHTNRSDAFEKHSYVYDSVGRIAIDSNLSYYPNNPGCHVSYHTWNNNELTIKTITSISRRTYYQPEQVIGFNIQKYTFHSNDSVRSRTIGYYSSLNTDLESDKQFFKYDTLGNIVEFSFSSPTPEDNNNGSRTIINYTYDNQGQILNKTRTQYFNRFKKKTYYYKYTYTYW